MKWSAEDKQAAASLWARGVSGVDIAAQLNVSPDEVYGLARRNKDLFRQRPRGRTGSARRVSEPAIIVRPRHPKAAPNSLGVPRGRLGACACEFPLWGDHESFDADASPFCGAPRAAGSRRPYCDFHDKATRGSGTPIERRATADALAIAAREGLAA